MTNFTLPKVSPDEASPPARSYILRCPDGSVGDHLQSQVKELESLCSSLSDAAAISSYAEGKWTIKEVIGHLLDAERIFAYRILRISRGDETELPGFDENKYAPEGLFNLRRLEDLLTEFRIQRASTLALLNGIPPEAWPRKGMVNDHAVTARAIVYIIQGHTAHHLAILRERYGLAER